MRWDSGLDFAGSSVELISSVGLRHPEEVPIRVHGATKRLPLACKLGPRSPAQLGDHKFFCSPVSLIPPNALFILFGVSVGSPASSALTTLWSSGKLPNNIIHP